MYNPLWMPLRWIDGQGVAMQGGRSNSRLLCLNMYLLLALDGLRDLAQNLA